MVQHHSDESLHRLQASDPATGSHPDLNRLRSLITHKAPASQGADRATRVDEDLLGGPAIRAPWVAAACIAALAIGAGGYAVGAQRGTGTLLVAGQDSLLSPAGAGMDAGLSAELSSGSVATSSSAGESAPQPYDPGPVRLVPADSLSSERSTAAVRVLRSDEDPEAFLEEWARTLGLQGEPMASDEDFFPEGNVGLAEAETGRMISASTEGGGLHVSYSDFFSSPYCREELAMAQGRERDTMQDYWEATFGSDTPLPTVDDCREITGERPTDEQAEQAARDFLTLAGVPTEGFTFQSSDYDRGSSVVYVEAAPPGGAYGPKHVSLTVGPSGVIDANAGLGEMVSIGDYPVISPVEAVERYGLREFSMEYGVQLPQDLEDLAPVRDGDLTFIEPKIPDAPEVADGMQIPLLLKDKEVTGARLVQATMYTQAGSMEVPTWELTTDDGMSYPVMAVADESIDWITWE